ncbi:hypothetical protein AVEN_134904-1 [Araneus ventricosus]|uniref:Histone-lysine N-methyltransferase SETMAR n=1 Tax=Araneus ventricosus TaxID=182803 RepID=A0A4Y2CIA9_ARAVE|nr:hypothetical protein AVEN_134904-1 [Araneus ventricosus]
MAVAERLLHGRSHPHDVWHTQQLLQQLCCEVFVHPTYKPDLAPSDYRLFQHLKRFMSKQNFRSDDDLQIDGCHRLTLLSGGRHLRHQ